MKRFISILFMVSLCTAFIFAEDNQQNDSQEQQDDTPAEEFVYEPNGAGDQSLKIGLMATFPLNFGKQLYVGGSAELGYYKFLTNTLALGGDILISYNVSLGEKSLITVPITFGAMFQPYVGNFEFPLTLGIGIASLSCQGMSYFPALTVKGSAGAFYRMSESWSFGITTTGFWIPQWVKDSSKNDNGLFLTAGVTARYHF